MRRPVHLAAIVAVLAAAAPAAAFDWTGLWLPENVNPYGDEIDRLFYWILWATGAVFVGVEVFFLWCLVAYRARPGRTAHYTHGSTTVEIIWTAIPALILVAIGVASKSAWTKVRETPPEDPYVIEVTARQFEWHVKYPGPDGDWGEPADGGMYRGTGDEFMKVNQFIVPANRKVLVRLTSQDVIHSFFVPQLRVKLDAVPGLVGKFWFESRRATTDEDEWEVACAELCGLGHTRMRGIMKALEPAAFDEWVRAEAIDAGVVPAPAADVVKTEASE